MKVGCSGLRPAAAATVISAFLLSACTAGPPAARAPWWARYAKPGATQTLALRGVPGSPAYRCVRAGDHSNVRSGGFLAGNFGADERLYAESYRQNGRRAAAKIYWVPLHVGRMAGLVIRASLLGGHLEVTSMWHLVGANPGVVFYPSAVRIPVPGTWKLVATAGPNRGCFIVTFVAPR